ncbi:hypothetical protein NE865_07533 [Phthorimaea operculella]|nr:hypothetical protein NE865_07533 [Phthorimaea operculella]
MIVNSFECSFHQCCFVYPLRKGLLVWGYLNLARYCIFDGISSAITATRIRYHFQYRDAVEYQDLVSIVAMFLATLFLSLTNLAFNIVLVVGIHKNDERMIRRFYYYWLVMQIAGILFIISNNVLRVVSESFSIWLTYHIDPVTYHVALEKPTIGAIDIVVQIYFLVLIRNLIRRLSKGDEQYIIDIDEWDSPSRPRTMLNTVKDVIDTQPTRDNYRF